MPSWSARNQSQPATTTPPTRPIATTSSSFPLPERSAPRLIPQNGTPGVPPVNSPPSRHQGHTRSISHPFPSPFGKRRNRSISTREFLDSDDDDDEVTFTPAPLPTSPKGKPLPRLPPGEELVTGKCMTCSSTVRWPRNLNVFRCTECLTVNDLEPYKDSNDPAGHGHLVKEATPPAPTIPRKAMPISVKRTRALIDGCVSSYLRNLLDAPAPRVSPNRNQNGNHVAVGNPSKSPNQTSGYLSDPRPPMDPRSRSSSASTPRKPEVMSGSPNKPLPYLTPVPHGEGQMRIRSNSAHNAPNGDRLPREATRQPDPGAKDKLGRPPIFKALEEYIISSFRGCDCLNNSFTTAQFSPPASENSPPTNSQNSTATSMVSDSSQAAIFEPDAKTLLIGDIAENSTFWMNDWTQSNGLRHAPSKEKLSSSSRPVTSRSPRINWAEMVQWYQLVLTAGTSWVEQWTGMEPLDIANEEDSLKSKRWHSINMSVIEREITDARLHVHRTLLKATENLLKRPRRPLKKPEEVRFLLILLANPLIYPSSPHSKAHAAASAARDERRPSHPRDGHKLAPGDAKPSSRRELSSSSRTGGSGHHSGIIKRILGLLANLSNDCHHYLVSWFSRFSVGQFEKIVDLVGSFVTYRLTRQHGRKRSASTKNEDDSLVPSFSSAAGHTPAEFHAAINGRSSNKPAKDKQDKPVVYGEDWQVRVAARVMSLLFTANNANVSRKSDSVPGQEAGPATKHPGGRRGHLIPISSFYNTLLDYSDLVADFEAWESKASKFSFCQYPFFLSIWAKIHVLEHDARRQMEVKAREAFFNSILSRKAISQYLVLKVRRDCLVEDSLRGVSEVVGSSQEEIKKGLRIEFLGEEGVDAGGLRKEWFLLLVREVFDPHHGLFLYDEDSQYCYFNPFCFESSEQFFLVGTLLGLAIYNSTILDIALPPFAFKKLLAAAPQSNGPQTSTSRSSFKCTLDDLAEYRPVLAKGLRGLLDFEGDVTETFCYDFVAQVDRYGEVIEVPLCPGGEKRPVTNSNRREFVDLYIQYLLDTAVTRQFEPFKRGFFSVVGGNALSLFRPEEIELLVRGSDDALDVASLRAVATYDNWSVARPESVPVVKWFWEFFEQTNPQAQRKILSFITGSDRIPAMGATSLMIRLACLGDDSSRYPTARTCFNTLGLYRYDRKEKLERKLWDAVINSEGFGLK
ncbi:putative E3 ubiquitin-protein ligase [Aspergillus wentii]|nr:putative E3 ubiquitin-protein ligase [Aspergillus wentii]